MGIINKLLTGVASFIKKEILTVGKLCGIESMKHLLMLIILISVGMSKYVDNTNLYGGMSAAQTDTSGLGVESQSQDNRFGSMPMRTLNGPNGGATDLAGIRRQITGNRNMKNEIDILAGLGKLAEAILPHAIKAIGGLLGGGK